MIDRVEQFIPYLNQFTIMPPRLFAITSDTQLGWWRCLTGDDGLAVGDSDALSAGFLGETLTALRRKRWSI